MAVRKLPAFCPEKTWFELAFHGLQEALGHKLDLWVYDRNFDWELVRANQHQDDQSPSSLFDKVARREIVELVKKCHAERAAAVSETAENSFLLAIPLGSTRNQAHAIATTVVETNNPEMLLGMARVSQQYFIQQEELIRTQEENDYFLKQVSDDFEELTFLREMAENLRLEEGAQSLHDLIRKIVPRLSSALNAESCYFIDGSHDQREIVTEWHRDPDKSPLLNVQMIDHLVEHYREQAQNHPYVENELVSTREAKMFPGVREIMLVSSASNLGQVGWFLVINRAHEPNETNQPPWRVSQEEFGTNEAYLLNTAAVMLASHANNLSLFREREVLLINVVRTLVSAVEAKDPYTCGHSERVALYAKCLAVHLGYDEEAVEKLYLTGLLHDIGKIAVSDAILKKPHHLTDEEFAEIKRHPDEGWKILHGLEQLSYVLPGVLHHHERIDGKGYPDGLCDTEIPMDGKILAVADAYDAMTSDRAYRSGMSQERAEEILHSGAGTQWDKRVVDAFFEVVPQIIKLRESYRQRKRPSRRGASLPEISAETSAIACEA